MLKYSDFTGVPLLLDLTEETEVDLGEGSISIFREELSINQEYWQHAFVVTYAPGKCIDIRSVEDSAVLVQAEGEVLFPKECFNTIEGYMSSFEDDWDVQMDVLGLKNDLPWDDKKLIPIIKTLVYLKFIEGRFSS